MRFSLKWLLAAMAYAALAATAIGQRSSMLADLAWVATIVAICYALLVALAWDRRRGAALGFVALSLANLISIYMEPERIPSSRVLRAAGYIVSNRGALYQERPADMMVSGPPRLPATQWESVAGGESLIRTANAAGTMVAGLVGCVLGTIAFRSPRSSTESTGA